MSKRNGCLKVLVISAHSDDFECGVSGLISKMVKDGHKIVSLITALPDNNQESMVREKESWDAHAILRIKPTFLYEAKHKQVTLEIREFFGVVIKKIKPNVVVCHWPVDIHPDHRASAAISIEPFLQKGTNTELFCFEVASRPGQPQSLGFFPNYYVDVNEVFDLKKQMISCHRSQDLNGMWQAHLEMMERRGLESRRKYAEAYIRLTRFGDIMPELRKYFEPSNYKLPKSNGVAVTPKALGIN